MSVRGRDVIFEFKDSCNCCWSTPLEDNDPVYVSPRGAVQKFDFKRAPSADINAKSAMANLQARITELAESQQQVQEILAAIQRQMNLNLERDVRVLRTTDVRRIEAIALPILRAPSPIPVEPPPTPRIERHSTQLVRSEKSRDLRLEHSQAEWE